VDDDGPADFPTIQQAISAASPGDTIFVYGGTYYENVVVDKTVSLVGENKSTTIIDAHRIGSVVVVTANDVGIRGFTTRNSSISLSSPQPGIGIRGSRAIVTGNIVRENYYGIFLQDSNNNSVIDNEIYSNDDLAIALSGSDNNTLVGNNVSSNRLGIHLSYSGNNTLIGNVMNSNSWNFGVWGGNDADFENDIDMSNLVDGKPIYYLKRVSNSVYDSSTNAGAFFLINSTNVTVRDLNLSRNIQNAFLWKTSNSRIENLTVPSTYDAGIALCYSDNVTITGSRVTDSYYGVLLESSNSSKIIDNYLNANWWYGIFLEHSRDCTIEGNVATNTINKSGIEVNNSHNNTVRRNTASGNINGIIMRIGAANNTVVRNIASYNNFGISVVADSYGNHIINNDILNNLYGIDLGTFTSNNVVSGNVISSNSKYGIWLWNANNNLIFHNNILNNPTQVYNYNSINTWDDGYPSGGNYWSDYTSTDFYSGPYQNVTGSDGIGDTSYIIPGRSGTPNNVDYYPLMNPYIAGDVDYNGIVNSSDLSALAQSYGAVSESTNWNARADNNFDGIIDVRDLFTLGRNYGKTNP
jgi:parallel beta-helix repeat protein